MVLVTDRADASLRWAGNSMTTNGESVQPQHDGDFGCAATVIAPTSARCDPARWIPSAIPDLVAASQEAALLRARSPGQRAAAGRRQTSQTIGTHRCPATGAEVFAGVADALARGFRGADQLYGYARHIVETTFVATSNGLRRRYTQPTGSVEINAKRNGASAWVGHRHTRLRRCANRFHARTAVDAAGLGAAHRRAARRALRDDHAAVDGGRHDDLPDVEHGRPRRAGGPHRAVGARRRHAGGGEAQRSAADAVLGSLGGRAGVHAVRGGAQFVGAGVDLRQRHGHRAGGLDPRRHDQRAGLSAGGGRRVRRTGRGARRQPADDRRLGEPGRHDREHRARACC